MTMQVTALTDWSVASRPFAGQVVSGDLHLVKPFDDGVLLAVVDGMGHGPEAHIAAETARDVLKQFADEPVIALMSRCHEALKITRGAVMTLATVSGRQHVVTWIGVGNVQGRLFRINPHASHPSESVLLRAGVVGYQLPALHAGVIPIARGDMLVFATDGIGEGFADEIRMKESLPALATRILNRHGKESDDALVLVARYLGAKNEIAQAWI